MINALLQYDKTTGITIKLVAKHGDDRAMLQAFLDGDGSLAILRRDGVTRVGGDEDFVVIGWSKSDATESYRRQLEEAILAREALRLDPREGLADTCRELVEILGCPADTHLTEWARRVVDDRRHKSQELMDINAELAVAPDGTLAQAVRLLQRECTEAVRSNRALEATVEAYQRGTGSYADRLRKDYIAASAERDELRVQTSAVDKLLVDIAGIDRIEKIKGLLGRGLELAAVDEALGRCAGENRLTLLGKLLRRASERDGYCGAVASANEELLAVANALGAKTTRDLVGLAKRVKAAADGVDGTSWVSADQAFRLKQRCAVLEKRLAAIRATADGKTDA